MFLTKSDPLNVEDFDQAERNAILSVLNRDKQLRESERKRLLVSRQKYKHFVYCHTQNVEKFNETLFDRFLPRCSFCDEFMTFGVQFCSDLSRADFDLVVVFNPVLDNKKFNMSKMFAYQL